jgi:hypothetical protein
VLACGKQEPMDEDMPPVAADMSGEVKDLSMPPAPDLAENPDLSPTDKPMLMGLPMCLDEILTAEQLHERSVSKNCSVGMCHGRWNSATAMKTAWVGKASSVMEVTLPLVTPGKVHESYVLYKIMGQHRHALVKGAGDRMPKGRDMLPDGDICNFINWIRGGAN